MVAAKQVPRRARQKWRQSPDGSGRHVSGWSAGHHFISRHPESLLAKTRALNEEGISAWMLTGAYHVPSRTITGSVEKDVAIIDRVIGVKCAISDHRSAAPDVYHLANMAAESRVGGLLGGKPGVTVFHMGDSKKALQPVYDLLETGDVPISKLLPTHVNRNVPLFEQALEFARKGGTIDITSSIDEPVAPAEVLPRRSGGYRWHASPSAPTATVASRSMTKGI